MFANIFIFQQAQEVSFHNILFSNNLQDGWS